MHLLRIVIVLSVVLLCTLASPNVENNVVVDNVPLTVVAFTNRNLTIYTSASNPSREPRAWRFWYDPLIIFDASKDIRQYNEYLRFSFSLASSEFDHLARTTIVTRMHPDTEQFSLFWTVEPLPVDTLTAYIVNQLLAPIPAIYPCSKSHLSGTATFECQFQGSSMIAAHSITQQVLCGKLKVQFDLYTQSATLPISIPKRLATNQNLKGLAASVGIGKYIHKTQGSKLVGQYFVQIQSIVDTIKEADIFALFQLAMKTTARLKLNTDEAFREMWSPEDMSRAALESIINNDLFYISLKSKNKVVFHLKKSKSPWALTSKGKQTLNIAEVHEMLLNEHHIDSEWSPKEARWKVKSYTVHLLQDVLDVFQLTLINKQYALDKINATFHRTIDCADWSPTCSCQSNVPAVAFTSTTHLIVLPNVDMDISTTGFSIELWVRPDALPRDLVSSTLVGFRDEYRISYQSKGQVTFAAVVDETQSNLFATTLQAIPLGQWTHVAGVLSIAEDQLQLYINGEFVSSASLASRRQRVNKRRLINDITIGRDFLGAVREVRLWACARTPEEILFMMNAKRLLGNETCLAGLWPMADGAGQIVQDLLIPSPISGAVPHPGTLGFDDNPNLYADPVWTVVIPAPTPPPPPRTLRYQMFRENITLPIIIQWGTPFDEPVPGDYDGDGFADFAVYRKTTMTWIISSSNDPNVLITKFWGLPGDHPVHGDFDGDHRYDFTIFRPATASWSTFLTTNPAFQYVHVWGRPDDEPVPGDYDGDHKADFAVYREGIWYINPSSDPSVQWTKKWGAPGDVPVYNCDFDGDGKSDFTVWTPIVGLWSWMPSSNPLMMYKRPWGVGHDLPFCADFDGDKRSDFGVYRRWTGEWFIIPYRASSFLITFQWGHPTDFPVAGDYDGDLRAEYGLWRPRTNRTFLWEVIPSTMPVVKMRKNWGIEGDVPVVGDFDGDKRADFTVWRPNNGFWYVLLIHSPGIQIIKHWGFSRNDTAVAADWDGDGLTDYTIYRPRTGFWYIMLNKNPILQIAMQWGVGRYNDVPVPGDFDGDGKSDFAVWRPSTGVWFILPSKNPAKIVMTQWGLPKDIPVTGSDFDGDGKTDIAVWRPSTGTWYILPSSNPTVRFGPHYIRMPTQPLPTAVSAKSEVPAEPVADNRPDEETTPSSDNANKG